MATEGAVKIGGVQHSGIADASPDVKAAECHLGGENHVLVQIVWNRLEGWDKSNDDSTSVIQW